jgi:enolase 1/2/3
MLNSRKIKKIKAREILDSRGHPTIEVKVLLKNGVWAKAAVPSGASTGIHEALELRDNNKKRYLGKGVLKAVKNVNKDINYLLKNIDITKQQDIDKLMIKLDDTENKSSLGANAILGVSLACARAGAKANALPLYRYLRKVYKIHYKSYNLPIPMMNIMNGGVHAGFALDIQEAMIVPNAKKMSKRVQIGSEVFHHLGAILKKKNHNTFVGDEGGYAVSLKKNEEAFKLIISAIKKAGYKPFKDVNLAIDAAASEFYNKTTKRYKLGKNLSANKTIELYKSWLRKYKLISIEDGLAEDDWENWKKLTAKLGGKSLQVGDDLFVTNTKRLQKGIDMGVANSILIKLNQIGTLTETISAIYLAKQNDYKTIISHRSGETSDTFIADLAVAVNADYIKTGSMSRSERVAKYNRLMEIEEELG